MCFFTHSLLDVLLHFVDCHLWHMLLNWKTGLIWTYIIYIYMYIFYCFVLCRTCYRYIVASIDFLLVVIPLMSLRSASCTMRSKTRWPFLKSLNCRTEACMAAELHFLLLFLLLLPFCHLMMIVFYLHFL